MIEPVRTIDEPEEIQQLRERLSILRREKARRLRVRLRELWRAKALRWDTDGAFEAFVKLCWPVIEPKPLEWAPYMGVVCHALHRQILGDPDYQKLLIILPPGFAKSILVSVMAPAFEWLGNPGRRKIFFSASDNVAIRDSRRTRILIQSDVYKDLMRAYCLADGREPWALAFDQNQKANFENGERGFRQCLTISSRVIGSRGDDQVIDDPVDVKDVTYGTADLITKRMKQVNDTIEQVLSTRINDRREARRTLVMQRLHPHDPAGRAIANGGWKVICLPLRFDPDHPQLCSEDPRSEPGELLHPQFLPEAEARELEAELGTQAPGQLQQMPGAGGAGKISEEWLDHRYTCTPQDIANQADEVWITNDSNSKPGANNAESDWQVWARTGARYDLLDWVHKSVGYPEFERITNDLIRKWQAHIRATSGGVLIEDTAHGTTYLQVSRSQWPFLVDFAPTRDTPGKGGDRKERAFAFVVRAAESKAIWLPDSAVWIHDWIASICASIGIGQDTKDACSQLIMRWMLSEDDLPEIVVTGQPQAHEGRRW